MGLILEDRRKEERVKAMFAVFLQPLARGVARDVSASAMYVQTDTAFSIGDPVQFSVEFVASGEKMALNCRGEIIRMGQSAERLGVVIRFADAIMNMIQGGSNLSSLR